MSVPVSREAPSDRSVATLLHDLSDGVGQLVKQEIRLARTEMLESVMVLKRGSVWIGAGLVLALGAFGALIAFLILGVSQLLGGMAWLAAVIVALVLGFVGWLLVRHGAGALGGASLAPKKTTSSIKETAEWLKHPTRSAES